MGLTDYLVGFLQRQLLRSAMFYDQKNDAWLIINKNAVDIEFEADPWADTCMGVVIAVDNKHSSDNDALFAV